MYVHLLSVYINELDNTIEDVLLLYLQTMTLEETAWTKDRVQFQKDNDKLPGWSDKPWIAFSSVK